MNKKYQFMQYVIYFMIIGTLFSLYMYRLYVDVYQNKKIIRDLSPDDIYFRPDPILMMKDTN